MLRAGRLWAVRRQRSGAASVPCTVFGASRMHLELCGIRVKDKKREEILRQAMRFFEKKVRGPLDSLKVNRISEDDSREDLRGLSPAHLLHLLGHQPQCSTPFHSLRPQAESSRCFHYPPPTRLMTCPPPHTHLTTPQHTHTHT